MRVAHYGNACFSLFHQGVHILCDPWLEAPAVAGGWEKFPPTEIRVRDIPKPDYLYISHIHSDHCEPETLAKLDKETPVIGLSRQPAYLERMLHQQGFRNLRLVPEGRPTEIAPGFRVETFAATFNHAVAEVIDSSAIFDFGGCVVLNCNDNLPEEPFCREVAKRYPRIDLAFLPCTGGGSFPAMYGNFSDSEKEAIIARVLDQKAEVFGRAVDLLRPKMIVPVAGGYAVRGLHHPKVNWQQIRRLNLEEIIECQRRRGGFQSRILFLQPGMELDADRGEIIKGTYRAWGREELQKHFERLSVTPVVKSLNTHRKLFALGRLVRNARAQLWRRQQQAKMFPSYRVILDVEGQPVLFEIDLQQEEVREQPRSEPLREPYLKMTLDQDTMLEWLLGFEDFNMLDSGHRIAFFRAPNVYVQEAYYLMSLFRL